MGGVAKMMKNLQLSTAEKRGGGEDWWERLGGEGICDTPDDW